jgi:ribonuclease P protein component
VKAPEQKFPKSARLLKHADFERVYRTGQRQFSANLSVFFLRPRVEAGSASAALAPGIRVGLGVGRALGGAVERNRIKRRMREAVRRHLPVLTPPLDVVINPKRSVAEMEFARLTSEVERAFTAIETGKGKAGAGRA